MNYNSRRNINPRGNTNPRVFRKMERKVEQLKSSLIDKAADVVMQYIIKFINTEFVYSFSVDRIRYILNDHGGMFFKHMNQTIADAFCVDVSNEIGISVDDIKPVTSVYGVDSEGMFDFCIYKGTVVVLYSANIENRTSRLKMSCLNTKKDIRNMKEMLSIMSKKYIHDLKNNWNQITNIAGTEQSVTTKQFRTFDDIFIPKEIEMKIKSALDNFVNKKDWYKEHNIPYHFGIMLYGDPGTGKSITAQAIASYLKTPIYMLNGDTVTSLGYAIKHSIYDVPSTGKPKIILIEDIDTGMISPRKTKKHNQEKLINSLSDTISENVLSSINENNNNNPTTFIRHSKSLGELLNVLDGLGAPSNVIYIFTTNHVDEIDPAVIRPGRIDLKIEISGITEETLSMFLVKHYKKKLDRHIDIRKDLTFAELQIQVLSGLTYDEIIEYCKEKE